jgi:uncharacterized repeat protein (TIGR01451 family)
MFNKASLRTLCITFMVLSSSCFSFAASQNYGTYDQKSSSTSYFTIDPNDYDFLIYNCHGSEERIGAAMEELGITNYTERDGDDPVTANDLATHDILITTWNANGDSSGLDPDILYAGITGRVILTGHDSDYHTAAGIEESKRFFSQMINYVLTSSTNTGLIGLADATSAFNWVPSEWNLSATSNSGENIEEFTLEGLDSGIYDGLTPEGMSDWQVSYHNTFTAFDSEFATFELGGAGGDEIITIANISPYNIDFDKYDDVNDDPNFVTCISPEEQITYTICWENNGSETFYNVTIVDYLPIGVDYGSITDPNYSSANLTYIWDIGTLVPDSSVCVTLDVTVNYNNTPGVPIRNVAHLKSDDSIISVTNVVTPLCCFGRDIVYVDKKATGFETGTTWANAYAELQDALERIAETGCGDEVWVTGGTYSPGNDPTNTFTIPDGVYVYGGLVGNEPNSFDPNDREFIQQKTVLTGLIRMENEEEIKNEDVVTMGHYTKVHGFTVEDALHHGVYGSGSNFSVYRSIIKDNDDTGIRCANSAVKVRWCTIRDNVDDGIYHSGGGLLHIKNSDIFDNGWNGIYTYGSNAVVLNSNIHHNGWDKRSDYDNGLRFRSPPTKPTVRNCTIMRNEGNGIYFSGSPSYKPDIYNCIFYNNNYHDVLNPLTQFHGDLTAYYSSVTDPADPNSTDCTVDDDNNMKCDPKFAYININDHNLHLASDSPCIDMGNSLLVEAGELDIDSDARIDDTDVDMGADEVSCTDEISNPLDWNGDGLVNNGEHDIFSKAWLSYNPDEYTGDDPNETINWDPRCDFNNDHHINYADFAAFGIEWLWQACWRASGTGVWMMMGSGMGRMAGGESMLISEPAAEQQVSETQPQTEPSVEEQIEQIKQSLACLYEIKDQVDDEEALLGMVTSLEEMLKELEDSQ